MSKGISISSINQIKELAEEKRYAEALEILDTQDLDRSINPQFLRISGEIFRKNKRYYDSRRVLLKAHQMSPQGTRIISELIQLYLELGYFSLADKYYEEYNFYVGSEDTQKDFIEYIVKKAKKADVKELASILIPILERMPEDRWNYEAVLLYDKLDRKDKALDESRFILENFKDSVYVDRVIAYIDDKLNVDDEFYIYPDSEKEDDKDTFGDLIELEQKLLEKDYLEMYPPEARIVVEVEDKDGIEAKPVKEKKPKKKKRLKKKAVSEQEDNTFDDKNDTSAPSDQTDSNDSEKQTDIKQSDEGIPKQDDGELHSDHKDVPLGEQNPEKETVSEHADSTDEVEKTESEKTESEKEISENESSDTQEVVSEPELSEEERIKQEREEALEKLLLKKFDPEAIKESAKQLADAVKNIDTSKAKVQVKAVTSRVSDNVKRASDVLSEAVGAKATIESPEQETVTPDEEMFVDGIIEDVLEPPKQTIGQVVMNEELDSLVPDSIEAMSADEIADIELRKEEQERLELEALEAAVKLEEEKREKKKRGKSPKESEESLYSMLKNQFIENYVKEEPVVDSLGFISVVHSDVDETMEEHIPDTAQMLHQMIDNKEYYNDENSLGFETKDSYNNHGFEIESYDASSNEPDEKFVYIRQDYNSDVYKVEDIYVEEPILSFDDLIPDEIVPMDDYVQSDEWTHKSRLIDESIISIVDDDFENKENVEESVMQEEISDSESQEIAYTVETEDMQAETEDSKDETVAYGAEPETEAVQAETEDSKDETVAYGEELETEAVQAETEDSKDETVAYGEEPETEVVQAENISSVAEDTAYRSNVSDVAEETVIGEQLSFDIETPSEKAKRERIELRTRIIISDSMEKKLLALKEAK